MTPGAPRALESGSLGFFWAPEKWPPDLNEHAEFGWARFENNVVRIDVLDEDVMESIDRGPGRPAAWVGVLPEDSLLLLELHPTKVTHRFSRVPRASSRQYEARTVIGNVPVDELRSARLLEMTAHFHGIDWWAGMSAAREEWTESRGSERGWSLQVSEGEALSAPLSRGRVLEVSASWGVDGPTDRRVVSAPIAIGCRAKRPRDARDLLEPLIHVQNLLNLAFRGLVVAEGGAATVDIGGTPDPRRGRPTVWTGHLSARPCSAIEPKNMTGRPMFDLKSLGGIQGVARWIRLCEQHPRAVAAVSRPFRVGPSSPEVALLETAAAMEYWVRANQPSKWAASKRYAQATAGRAGRAFAEWVGDPEAWGTAFWKANNDLKHDPAASIDARELSELSLAGHYLLTAVLLDRAAGTRAPSRTIFRSPHVVDLGQRLRNQFN